MERTRYVVCHEIFLARVIKNRRVEVKIVLNEARGYG